MSLRRRRRFPLLRATAELANAANAVQPLGRDGYITLPVFAFGWPTGEAAPVVAGASVLDAVRRGLRGDFKGTRGRIALALTAISWGLLGYVYVRATKSQPSFEEPLREVLGEDYAAVAKEERRRRPGGVLPTPSSLSPVSCLSQGISIRAREQIPAPAYLLHLLYQLGRGAALATRVGPSGPSQRPYIRLPHPATSSQDAGTAYDSAAVSYGARRLRRSRSLTAPTQSSAIAPGSGTSASKIK